MQRTWPHVMTTEAVYGAEQQQTGPPSTPSCRSPATSSPAWTTPRSPSASTNRDTTDAHELATAVVFESGWQHDADNPASYEARPEALRILNQLPTAWDETRLLGGRPGREAYLARRNGGKWYVGGISALAAKTYQAPLNFLGGGQWLARDRPRRLWRSAARNPGRDEHGHAVACRCRTRGGFATVLCPYTSRDDDLRHRAARAGSSRARSPGCASTSPTTARPTARPSTCGTATAAPTRTGRRPRPGS